MIAGTKGNRKARQQKEEQKEEQDNQILERWVTILIAPIIFSVDNFLCGGAINKIVIVVAGKNNVAPFWIFAVCASCTIIGVLVAMCVHLLTEILAILGHDDPSGRLRYVAELLRISFLLVVTLSFLDASLALIQTGLTLWVTMGVGIGWALEYCEVGCDFLVALTKRYWRRKGVCRRCT